MSYNKLSPYATTIQNEDGWYKVVYHSTTIVKWNDEQIVLNTGGYFTATTKKKMNQASQQFDLGFSVYQENSHWFVCYEQAIFSSASGKTLQAETTAQFIGDTFVITRKQEA
jgi:5-hydroxyisourate hydrolase-like protein (transthyretin family)